ncbi:hypothetical protein CDAR_267601 [Caerostris darwini]|uniref:Uncharacterized protein n=1 Tax=Caerostris darwini TaxID=1538125 RepID=A0AAV4U461_9ARAC|nr:hypothetical protein CDAR_267601 [Caerostris darwini]
MPMDCNDEPGRLSAYQVCLRGIFQAESSLSLKNGVNFGSRKFSGGGSGEGTSLLCKQVRYFASANTDMRRHPLQTYGTSLTQI